jgi:hypothetical protein
MTAELIFWGVGGGSLEKGDRSKQVTRREGSADGKPYRWCKAPRTGIAVSSQDVAARPGASHRAPRARLCAQAAMGSAVIVAGVLAQDALGLTLAEYHDAVEAIATQGTHQPGRRLPRVVTVGGFAGDCATRRFRPRSNLAG